MLQNAQRNKPGTSVGGSRQRGSLNNRINNQNMTSDGMKFININENIKASMGSKKFAKNLPKYQQKIYS